MAPTRSSPTILQYVPGIGGTFASSPPPWPCLGCKPRDSKRSPSTAAPLLVRLLAVHFKKEGVMPQVQHKQRRSRKVERLEARVTPAQKRLIERAASLRGTSVTEFVVASAQEGATTTIKDFDVLQLLEQHP